MKESVQIAYTYSKTFESEYLKSNYLSSYYKSDSNEIHIHAPEGATPKDGPSAGVTITSALLSLVLNKPIKQNFAMTGEISLRGNVHLILRLCKLEVKKRRFWLHRGKKSLT